MRASVPYVLIACTATVTWAESGLEYSSIEVTRRAHVLPQPSSAQRSLLQSEHLSKKSSTGSIHASETQDQEHGAVHFKAKTKHITVLSPVEEKDEELDEPPVLKGKGHHRASAHHELSPHEASLTLTQQQQGKKGQSKTNKNAAPGGNDGNDADGESDVALKEILARANVGDAPPNDQDVSVRMQQKEPVTDVPDEEARNRHIFIFLSIGLVIAIFLCIICWQCFTFKCLGRIFGMGITATTMQEERKNSMPAEEDKKRDSLQGKPSGNQSETKRPSGNQSETKSSGPQDKSKQQL